MSDFQRGFNGEAAGELVQRLALYAYSLFRCYPHPASEPVLKISGKGPEDLAMEVMLRFLDPGDASVHWDETRGVPTVARVLPFLKKVLWNDFVDLTRGGLYRRTDTSLPAEALDQFTGPGESPEAATARREQQAQLLARLENEPDLQRLLGEQLPPEGYQAFTNQQLAARLGVSVSEIENRKKRLMLRLLRFAREAQIQPRGGYVQQRR